MRHPTTVIGSSDQGKVCRVCTKPKKGKFKAESQTSVLRRNSICNYISMYMLLAVLMSILALGSWLLGSWEANIEGRGFVYVLYYCKQWLNSIQKRDR